MNCVIMHRIAEFQRSIMGLRVFLWHFARHFIRHFVQGLHATSQLSNADYHHKCLARLWTISRQILEARLETFEGIAKNVTHCAKVMANCLVPVKLVQYYSSNHSNPRKNDQREWRTIKRRRAKTMRPNAILTQVI